MILRALFGSALFVLALVWGAFVLAENDRCTQIELGTAPVRIVMKGLRMVDRNFEVVADRLTWLSWSLRVDEAAQRFLLRLVHGTEVKCMASRDGMVEQSNEPIDIEDAASDDLYPAFWER